MSTLLLKHADLLVTMDAARQRIPDGGLFVRDNEMRRSAARLTCRKRRMRSSILAVTLCCPAW